MLPHPERWSVTWPVIAAGAMAGASLRYGVSRWITPDASFSWPTFIVNVAGSFLLGGLVGFGATRRVPERIRHLVGTGFCGALTTFSTLALEVVRSVRSIYILSMVAAGFGAAWVGLRAGRRAAA